MLKLILKDLKVSKESYIMYGVLFFILFELYSVLHLGGLAETSKNTSSAVVIAGYFLLFIIIQFNTFYMDYKNDSLHLIGSMPVKRGDIVKSKYLFMISFFLSPMILYIINVIIQKLISADINSETLKGNFTLLVFAIGVMLFLSSIEMPIFYLLDYKKANNICSALSFVLIFTLISLFAALKGISILEAIDSLNTLNVTLTQTTVITAVLFSSIVFVFSAVISEKILERKDL